MKNLGEYCEIIKNARYEIKDGKSVDKIVLDGRVVEAAGVILQNYDKMYYFDLEEFLYLCNDIYTYSEEGYVLISDRAYDEVMNYYISLGKQRIIYPDNIRESNRWPLIKHEDPGIVGSLRKCYDEFEFESYLTGMPEDELRNGLKAHTLYKDYIIAPKYDGISGAIKVVDGEIEYVATRRDGVYGQNITECIATYDRLSSIEQLFTKSFQLLYPDEKVPSLRNGFYKVEFLVSTDSFKLLSIATNDKYANRRSATAGICNTPKNIKFGKYITALPLLFKPMEENRVYYAPPLSIRLSRVTPSFITNRVMELMQLARSSVFDYRVDGVVCFPDYSDDLNMTDYMDNAMAYKINTAENVTKVKDGYVSVGIMGKAVPMVKVEPVEVNETMVQDVSLGSWDKYLSMDLHVGESIEIFSAGDVIPQARMPKYRTYPDGAAKVKIPRCCPYCGEKFKSYKNEYWCINNRCPRIQSGKIVNFVRKIGGKDIDEGTIENLFQERYVTDIEDFFLKTVDRLRESPLKGWGGKSINNLETELNRLMNEPIPISTFIGALGIKGVAKKKCRRIFSKVGLPWIVKHDALEVNGRLCGIDGIGEATAETFTNFVKENNKLIKRLMEIFKITEDKKYKGNVVFTGFRDEDLESDFDAIGYEVSDSINSETVLLVNGSRDNTSAKCRNAMKKGIDIVFRLDAPDVIKQMDASNE